MGATCSIFFVDAAHPRPFVVYLPDRRDLGMRFTEFRDRFAAPFGIFRHLIKTGRVRHWLGMLCDRAILSGC